MRGSTRRSHRRRALSFAPRPERALPSPTWIGAVRRAGLHPSPLPLALDLDRWLARAATTRGTPSRHPPAAKPLPPDGRKRPRCARADLPPTWRLRTGVNGASGSRRGRQRSPASSPPPAASAAPRMCCSGLAVHTAALLLRSADNAHPPGFANRSDLGRPQLHEPQRLRPLTRAAAEPVGLTRRPLQINDWYLTRGPQGEPLGNVQLLGPGDRPDPGRAADRSPTRSPPPRQSCARFHVMSEDLPQADKPSDDQGRRHRPRLATLQLGQAHLALVCQAEARRCDRAGYPVLLVQSLRPLDPVAHMRHPRGWAMIRPARVNRPLRAQP